MTSNKKTPAKKKKTLSVEGYIRLKKYVSQYHHFTFKNPRKGNDFKPAQKSAITRQFNKLKEYIIKARTEKMSFINTTRLRKKDIPKNDGLKTNKGFFFKYPFSNIQYVSLKRGEPKTNLIVTDFRKVQFSKISKGTTSSDTVQIYIAIPEYIKQSMDAIAEYIDALKKQYKPDYVMLSAEGRLYATQFNIKEFFSGSGRTVALPDENSDEVFTDETIDENERRFFYAVLLGFFKRELKQKQK